MADVAGFPARKAEAQTRGKLRGLGYASYIEACGLAPSNVAGALGARAGLFEAGEVRVHPTGSVTVFTGSHSHGQGHETTFAQVVAARLGMPVENVDVVHGDTGRVPFGMGTYGSRSLAVGGTAIVKALDKIVAKGKKIAAHLLEAAETDIEFNDGKFTVAGTDRSKTFGEVALTAYVPHNYPLDKLEPGLNETAFYDPTNFTFPAGTHICEVEIDPDTGVVQVVAFTACDDFGNIINPMIVEGQVHGGVAQGIGQALLEHCVYDRDSGQLLTGSLMDYALPRADDLPSFKVGTKVTPCTHNPLGAKGCGEAGAIGAPAAMMNAVHGCARAGRRQAPRHAGVAASRVERDPAGPRATHKESRMYAIDFQQPKTLADAAAVLASTGGRPLAGGQSLVAAMKLRLVATGHARRPRRASPSSRAFARMAIALVIGAMTRHAEVAASDVVKGAMPALASVAEGIGDRQVRNMGTLGGSLANNDPAADWPAAVLGCGATVRTNKRAIAADDFFKGMFETALAADEIITAVEFPDRRSARPTPSFRNPASRFALVGVFVAQAANGDVRVAVTGAAPSVFRATAIEDALGKSFTADAAKGVKVDAGGLNGDLHGSPEYRAHLVSVMASRAVAAMA